MVMMVPAAEGGAPLRHPRILFLPEGGDPDQATIVQNRRKTQATPPLARRLLSLASIADEAIRPLGCRGHVPAGPRSRPSTGTTGAGGSRSLSCGRRRPRAGRCRPRRDRSRTAPR
ncbi:hypothetical protein FZ938_21195 [Azospirillum oryzae]|nr:hypothetical protein FZ938_21195 [Azospirillum oryzae]